MMRQTLSTIAIVVGSILYNSCTASNLNESPLRPVKSGPLLIQAWGPDSIRVRSAPLGSSVEADAPGALSQTPPLATSPSSSTDFSHNSNTTNSLGSIAQTVSNGALRCKVDSNGLLGFYRINNVTNNDGTRGDVEQVLFSEATERQFNTTKYDRIHSLRIAFNLDIDEKVWGFGQVGSQALDRSGTCMWTYPTNGHIVIPLAHSPKGYSVLFNLPSYGEVCIDAIGQRNRQLRWYSRGAFNFDVWVTTSASKNTALSSALSHYMEVTGQPTPFPFWTTGFWQSKNRYRSTAEVISIVKEHVSRKIPLAVMVIDEGAWDILGNEQWGGCANGSITETGEPCPCWTNATNMTAELSALGVELMLSPYMQFAVKESKNFPNGSAARAFALGVDGYPDAGSPATIAYSGYNKGNADSGRCVNSSGGATHNPYCGASAMYDVFSKGSGALMMKHLTNTFYHEAGIKYWWLDCDEPCDYTGRVSAGDRLLWKNGTIPDIAIGAQYPTALNRAIYQHMTEELHEPHVVTLARSAWAGSQKYGTAIWSGDTSATFVSLRNQISEGQSAGLAGMSYWASDIGGYQGLDVSNRRGFDIDLLLRWFQFGAFSSIFRNHGYRSPVISATSPCSSDTRYTSGLGLTPTSGHNEVYTFTAADSIYNYSAAIIKVIHLRESMRAYVHSCFQEYSTTGAPVMRPMFYAFPDDPICSTPAASDQYMFGPSVLVAPIYQLCSANFSCTSRRVYLPLLTHNLKWTNIWTSESTRGGINITVAGSRDTFPVFTNVDPSAIFPNYQGWY
eukprot:m.153121 g.153121  ORF g.153121 m.153121 type:complete len:789 (-) comp30831_c0_seq1:646-3012(-)